MAEIGVVVLGAGYFAQHHLRAWRDDARARILAVVDRDAGRARAAAAAFGGRAMTDVDAALALGPDLADVVLPPEAHLPVIERCTAARIPVICQKPFCGGLAGARRAAALSAAAGTPVVVHENFRWQPWWRRVRAEVEAGRIGEPYQVTVRLRPGDGQGPRAYLDRQPYFRAMPRLLVHETAVHLIDVTRLLLGEPRWVWADLRRLNPVIAGEDAGLIVLGFDHGRRGLLDGNRLADHAASDRRRVMGEAWVEGSEGTITLDGDGTLALRPHGSDAAERVAVDFPEDRFGGGCVDALQSHVLDHLTRGTSLENEAGSYLGVMEIVEAVYTSDRDGCKVAVLQATEMP